MASGASSLSSKVNVIYKSGLAFGGDIKIAHSIFALPFAASAYFLIGAPSISLSQVIMLLVCMVSARSFAMGMNRYLDRDIDFLNPRTKIRAIPSGRISAFSTLLWSVFFASVFVAASFQLSELAGYMSVPLLIALMAYSFFKRFSWMTHWYLGFCLGLAPVAVAVVLSEAIPFSVLMLGLAVMFWTAGFDILYSIQDEKFDHSNKLHSVPSQFGIRGALYLSRVSFALMILCLFAIENVGLAYYIGVTSIALILLYEQYLVKDLPKEHSDKKINAAFFTVNGWVSVIFLLFIAMDFYL